MKTHKLQLYLVLSLLTIICVYPKGLMAQEHIFTKSITKTIKASHHHIIIDAEKANITITEAKGQDLVIDIKFISKHSNKAIAEKQLDYIKHVLNIKKRDVYLRNYILISANEELTGNITTEYTLEIPKNRNIRITNSLGNILVSNIEGNFNINSKYGKLNLYNLKGRLSLNAQIGEIIIKDSELNCIVESKYMSSHFYSCGGTYRIITNLGSINFSLTKTLIKLNIEASGTEISLSNKACREYNLTLISQSGSIFLDDCSIKNKAFIKTDTRNSTKEIQEFVYINSAIKQSITVQDKFANISLQ